jgi:hypothetical protein
MNQQPDKLFREKLASYQKTAPANAWNRIEAGLAPKKETGLWWKIAASLLLVAVATFILWPSTDPGTKPIATEVDKGVAKPENTSPIQKENVAEDLNVAKAEVHKEVQETAPSSKKSTTLPVQTEVAENKNASTNNLPQEPVELIQENHDSIYVAQEIVDAPTQPVPQPENVTPSLPRSTTLVFTREETSEYLVKNSEDEATPEDKNASTLKKLLKKANDLKNNQDPFGELRQKKNEILALNFKSEKQRGQNKQ